jgi:hypothetical protein
MELEGKVQVSAKAQSRERSIIKKSIGLDENESVLYLPKR